MATTIRRVDPWIGAAYSSEGFEGVRLLILGESEYGDLDDVSRTFTQENVRDLAINGRNAFFTKTTKLVLGLSAESWLSDEAKAEFWNRVAFYNFVQGLLAGARYRPTAEMWQSAVPPFLDVVNSVRPHLILVLGRTLVNFVPPLPAEIEVCHVNHPSSKGFSYARWASVVREAIDRAKIRVPGPPR